MLRPMAGEPGVRGARGVQFRRDRHELVLLIFVCIVEAGPGDCEVPRT